MRKRVLLAAAVLCGLLPAALAQTNFQRLKSFGFPGNSGPCLPRAPLIQGSDGALYGTTDVGGSQYAGTVYKVNRDGSGCVVLHSFSRAGGDGCNPYSAGLVEGTDGVLYGTTSGGGSNDLGTIFRLNRDGSGYSVLRGFERYGSEGVDPIGGLIEGRDGALYGTTAYGGSKNAGVVFKVNKDGNGFAVLRTFVGSGTDGQTPYAGVSEASDGVLYGTTYAGGISNLGTIFKLNKDGSGYQLLHSFGSAVGDGANPWSGLTECNDGALYGMTFGGGTNNLGTIFKLQKNGSGYSVLRSFSGGEAQQPYGALLKGSDGALYGTSHFGSGGYGVGCGVVFRLGSNGTGFTILRSFAGISARDGQQPWAGLIEGTDGALYGTTYAGGDYSGGTVFKLNKDGSGYQKLSSFLSAGGDGQNPPAGLAKGRDGALYGTTQSGGSNNFGTVFKLGCDGSSYTILKHFSCATDDVCWPYAGVIEGSDGALYGTAQSGSSSYGGVFRLAKDGGNYQVLHRFSFASGEGAYAESQLIEGTDGALYGTTLYGGTNQAGTVFALNKDGSGYTVLWRFSSTSGDGRCPYCGVIEGSDGMLYGTTKLGGARDLGTVFRLNKHGGQYSVLHSFVGSADGASPYAGLLAGSDGALYGTTYSGGEKNSGTVFRLARDGSGYTLLKSFTGLMNDGGGPRGGLVEGKDGVLYGTTAYSVFKLNKDGSGYANLRSFVPTPAGDQEQDLRGALVSDTDGVLYGVAYRGGAMGLGSVFQLFSTAPAPALRPLTRGGNGGLLLSWDAIPNLTYQVQYATNLAAPTWRALAPNVVAASNSASRTDFPDTTGQRFYRVQWIP